MCRVTVPTKDELCPRSTGVSRIRGESEAGGWNLVEEHPVARSLPPLVPGLPFLYHPGRIAT